MVKKQFPRNYRFIPELLKNISDELFILSGLVCLLFAILFVQADLYSNLKTKTKLDKEKVKVYNEVVYWQKQIELYPEYRDAYLYLSILSYQLGDIKQARLNFDKAIEIDPNYERKGEFEKIIR